MLPKFEAELERANREKQREAKRLQWLAQPRRSSSRVQEIELRRLTEEDDMKQFIEAQTHFDDPELTAKADKEKLLAPELLKVQAVFDDEKQRLEELERQRLRDEDRERRKRTKEVWCDVLLRMVPRLALPLVIALCDCS